MSNYNTLKDTINANIKQNGNQEITGSILNSVLNAMVTTLGAEYQFAGVATIDTNPGTPDAKVFYIANGKGTYTNFGGIEVTEDEVVVLYWDTSWHKGSTGIASDEKLTELGCEVGNMSLELGNSNNITTKGIVFNKDNWINASEKSLLKGGSTYSISLSGDVVLDESVNGRGIQLVYTNSKGEIAYIYSGKRIEPSTLTLTPEVDTYLFFRSKGYVSGIATAEIVKATNSIPSKIDELEDSNEIVVNEINKIDNNLMTDEGTVISTSAEINGAISSVGNATNWTDYVRTDLVSVNAGDIVVVNSIAPPSVAVLAKYIGSSNFFEPIVLGISSIEMEYKYFVKEDMQIVATTYNKVSNFYIKVYRNVVTEAYKESYKQSEDIRKNNSSLFLFEGLKNAEKVDIQIALTNHRLNSRGLAQSENGYSISYPIELKKDQEIVFEYFGSRSQYVCAIGLCDSDGNGISAAAMSTESIRTDKSETRAAISYYAAKEDCFVRLCRYNFSEDVPAYISYSRASKIERSVELANEKISENEIDIVSEYLGDGDAVTLSKIGREIYPRIKALCVDGLEDLLNKRISSEIREDNTGDVEWGNLSASAQQTIINLSGSSGGGGDSSFIPSNGDLTFKSINGINYLKFDSRIDNSKLNVVYDYLETSIDNHFMYTDTLYVVRFAHTSSGNKIVIPSNSTILFLGGSLKCDIEFNDTLLLGDIKLHGSTISGTISNEVVNANCLCRIDGVSDDARNLEMLFNSCKSVYLNEGDYRLLSVSSGYLGRPIHICIGGNCKIFGNRNARLITAKESCVIGLIGVSDVMMEGFTISVENDGTPINTKVNGYDNVVHESLHSIFIRSSSDISIFNVMFDGMWSDGVLVGTDSDDGYSENIRIEKCEMTSPIKNNRNGVSIESAKRVWVVGNYIHDMTDETMPGAIDVEPFKATHVIDSIFIRDNVCENIGGNTGAISVVSNSNMLKNVFINCNIIRNSYCGLFVKVIIENSSKNFIITDNVVEEGTTPNVFENTETIKGFVHKDNLTF